MSTPIWILIALSAAIGSAVIAFALARRGAPTRKQLEDLTAELESARAAARQVEGKVTEHFERSAMLFGQLAKDYKAFLDHYSDSAQALGLSERRARELIEQGYQPLLSHLEPEVNADTGTEPTVQEAEEVEELPADSAESVTEAEPSMIEDVIRVENASVPAADAERAAAGPEAASKVVEVDLGGESGRSQEADVPIGARKSGQG